MEHVRGANGDGGPSAGRAADESAVDLPDVGGLPLAELVGSSDSVLDNSLRRLLSDLEARPPERYAAFGSFLDESAPRGAERGPAGSG